MAFTNIKAEERRSSMMYALFSSEADANFYLKKLVKSVFANETTYGIHDPTNSGCANRPAHDTWKYCLPDTGFGEDEVCVDGTGDSTDPDVLVLKEINAVQTYQEKFYQYYNFFQ